VKATVPWMMKIPIFKPEETVKNSIFIRSDGLLERKNFACGWLRGGRNIIPFLTSGYPTESF
jgi:hypothetical protein